MPRLARLDAPGVLHHVIGRGIERKDVFLNSVDRNDFIARLAKLAQDGAMAVYAWSLLPNHFHLLCKTQQLPLSSSMRKLLTGYAVNFNRRHRRYGHLFQNRYKSIVCQEDAYLLELVRYIHLNLVRAGLIKDTRELNRSPWSGHSALMGHVKRDWQDTNYVLSFFGKGHEAKTRYLDFVSAGLTKGRRPELVGGGLIRSAGGWFEVLALRRSGNKQASDQRILGEGEFVQQLLEEIDEIGGKNLRLPHDRMDLDSLAERVSGVHGVRIGELRSGSRRHEIVEAR
ncbi:MAG: transposase, partial [Pseudomonadota bacterium]